MNPHLLANIACGEDNQKEFSEPSLISLRLDLSVSINTIEVLPKNGVLNLRSFPLLNNIPWVKVLPDLEPKINTECWKFPTPQEGSTDFVISKLLSDKNSEPDPQELVELVLEKSLTRVKPLKDMFQFKERLMYLLQPPIEEVFIGKEVTLPFKPFPYQIKGIAFLMPRKSALIADEMGLGKTIQVIVSIRLLFRSGLLKNVLIVCPKPLVINWTRELKLWAPDLPVEVICGNTEERKVSWNVSNTPVKLVNYELLTRDVIEGVAGNNFYDLMVIDEAQRIKTKESKTAQAVCSVQRDRSWAMTGTPIENRHDDLIHIFEFVDPGRVPKDTPPKMLASLTSESIIRRTKEEAAPDMPAKIIQDVFLDLTPAQRQAYDLAENEGVVHLNKLGDTATVQHVFELVMRLKQICNFDPRTGASSKAEQLFFPNG